MNKTCKKCLETKDINLFYGYMKRGKPAIRARCSDCLRLEAKNRSAFRRKSDPEIMRKAAENWRNKNKSKYDEMMLRSRVRRRIEVIEAYGGKCKCCGEDRFEFLSIDHIENNGNEMRKKHGDGVAYMSFLRKNKFPSGHQVLCHNCNLSKGFYGYCPHNKKDNTGYFDGWSKKGKQIFERKVIIQDGKPILNSNFKTATKAYENRSTKWDCIPNL